MLALYVVPAIIGLGLIVLAALGGLGHDMDLDHGSADVDHGDFHSDHTIEHASDFWLPFLSLRFWTYLFGGFGGFGLLLTLLGVRQEPIRFFCSLAMGLVAGLGAAWVFRWLSKSQLNSSVNDQDFLGCTGQVLVAPVGADPGKIRVHVKDDVIDLLALPLEGHSIQRGDEVVVVSIEGTRAVVANAGEYLNS